MVKYLIETPVKPQHDTCEMEVFGSVYQHYAHTVLGGDRNAKAKYITNTIY